MSLTAAIDGLRVALAAMDDIERIYDDPPEGVNDFPALMVYSRSGELSGISSGLSRNLHTLVVDVYESREILPAAIDRSKRWPDAVMAVLRADETLGGSVDAIVWPVRYRSTPMMYGKTTLYGVRFEVTVKIMESV